jgi:Na+/pantothenate symporter
LSVSLFVPVLAGLYNRRAGTPEALASIACGVTATVGIELLTRGAGFRLVTPAMIGLVAGALGFAFVFVARRPKSPAPAIGDAHFRM